MLHKDRVTQILQYALIVAGQGDDFHERALTPIHLIKYLYLADLGFAKFNGGQTFTGLPWIFHNFGPWSVQAFQQIDGSLEELGATKSTYPSQYADKNYSSWTVEYDETKFIELKRKLPLEVKQCVQYYVGKYRNNTTALLHFIYSTPPMLSAAPGESLDFSTQIAKKTEKPIKPTPFFDLLPKKKRNEFKAGMAELRKRVKNKAEKTSLYCQPVPVRIDTVFEEGVAWLDGLAGEPFPEKGTNVLFTDEVWKSKARSGDV